MRRTVGVDNLSWARSALALAGDPTVYGEQDVLNVLDDVQARFAVDPDRVLVTGFSMGAVGARLHT